MTDEVLRMRASIVTDEALTALRGLGRELGLTGRALNLAPARREVTLLQGSFSSVTREIKNFALPALSSFGFATGGVGIALAGIASATKDYAGKIRDLGQQSSSLQMTAKDIRALTMAGERFGITSEQMGTALANLKTNFYDFQRNLNVDGVADTLRQMGQGDLVNALRMAKDMGEATKLVQERLEFLQKVDPERAKRVAEALYGVAQMAHLSSQAIAEAATKVKDLTDEQLKAADNFNKAAVGMSHAWKSFTNGALANAAENSTAVLEKGEAMIRMFERFNALAPGNIDRNAKPELLPDTSKPQPEFGRRTIPRLRDGYRPMSFGGDTDGGAKETISEGVFEGMVKFAQFQTSGGASGFQNAAFSGGGGGSGGLAGAFPGNSDFPRVHGSGVAGSGAGPSAGSVSEAVRNMVPGLTGGDKVGGAFMEGRQRFAKELADNPALKEKLFGIVMGENKDDKAGRSVMESAMNRAVVRGTSLAAQLKLHAQSGINEGGYYAGFRPRDVARYRERLEGQLRDVLAGSNVSDYATDNASSWLADKHKRNGTFKMRKEYGRETFFSPDSRISKQYDRWRALVAESEASKVARTPDAEDIDFERSGFSRKALGGYSRKPIDPKMSPALPFGTRGSMLDAAAAMPQQPVTANGKVEINVHGNAKAEAKTTGELFQETKINRYKQMDSVSMGGGHPDGGY